MARKIKQVTFNTSQEKELLELAESMENFSWWVKSKLQDELARRKTGIDLAIFRSVEKLIDAKLAGKIVIQDTQIKAGSNDEIDPDQFF
jgi:hypothetical protein